jgi:TRAP-type mannitol/chloroaromatic compound transport system permease small subunit
LSRLVCFAIFNSGRVEGESQDAWVGLRRHLPDADRHQRRKAHNRGVVEVNWRNVLRLISADVKAHRLVRGKRFRRFRKNRLFTYALYIGACIFGVATGWLIGNFHSGVADQQLRELVLQGAVNIFLSLPTLALLYGLVFTQMRQIQRIGVKASIQPIYWFPITWEEHTLASILANLLGAPLIITTFVGSAVAVASGFLGVIPLAVFTILALLASVFLASATTEILKILQVRISGAVTKLAGRAAIWIRLLGSILFFIVFYMIYFSLYYNVTMQAPTAISIPLPESYVYAALPISWAIASVIAYVFYRIALKNAEEFLLKAEI